MRMASLTDTPKRIDHFNTIVGLIFAQLYENFPIPQDIDDSAIADAMGVQYAQRSSDPPIYDFDTLPNGDGFEWMMMAAMAWLVEEGFVRRDTEISSSEPVLTAKALAVMNATPPGLAGGKSIGSQLSDAAKGAGRTASNAAIGDLVGQAIGAAAGLAKGLF